MNAILFLMTLIAASAPPAALNNQPCTSSTIQPQMRWSTSPPAELTNTVQKDCPTRFSYKNNSGEPKEVIACNGSACESYRVLHGEKLCIYPSVPCPRGDGCTICSLGEVDTVFVGDVRIWYCDADGQHQVVMPAIGVWEDDETFRSDPPAEPDLSGITPDPDCPMAAEITNSTGQDWRLIACLNQRCVVVILFSRMKWCANDGKDCAPERQCNICCPFLVDAVYIDNLKILSCGDDPKGIWTGDEDVNECVGLECTGEVAP